MLLIERHVSAYSEAIIKFNNFRLCETNIFHWYVTCVRMNAESSIWSYFLRKNWSRLQSVIELTKWHEFFAALKLKIPEGRRKSPGITSYHWV